MLLFLGTVAGAACHLLLIVAAALLPVAGESAGAAAAAAVVAFTCGVRLLLLPLSYYSVRGQARQPDRLQHELRELYEREGGAALGGCLPALAQLPFFSMAYWLFRSPVIDGRPNLLLTRSLLGTPLGSRWLGAPGPVSAHGAVFLGLLALLAVACWLSARSARRAVPALPEAGTAAPARAGGPQAGAAAVLARILPYTTLAIATLMPLAAGLYLLTTTAWTAAERPLLARLAARRERQAAGRRRPAVPPGGPGPGRHSARGNRSA